MIVLGVTVVSAVWAYTYKVPVVVTFVDRLGTYHAPDRTMEQAWWAAPASVLIVVAGLAVVMWLLPGRRGMLRGFARQFGVEVPRRRRDRAGSVVLRNGSNSMSG